jgi:putative transposase
LAITTLPILKKLITDEDFHDAIAKNPNCDVEIFNILFKSEARGVHTSLAWVSDITYVRTHEGFLYVATVLDLFSRRIVGWSMDKNIDRHLVIRALMMAVWKRQPKETVLVHSDQGSQYGSADYLSFLRENNLKPSMSRRGNCHDNAVAESFFATFKKRVTQRKIYSTRSDAKTEIFNFIEMFYNPIKRHSHTGGISPVKFEEDYFSKLENV